MKEKEIKTYNVDGVLMQFNTIAFKELFNKHSNENRIKITDNEFRIGDFVGVSKDAVRSWKFGKNGPSDVETIIKLADYFKVDYKMLLKNKNEAKAMQISERQKDSLKRIYDSIIEYLVIFKQTDGFNEYWHKLMDKGVSS
ncbi:MAG: helix-turn-helix transcriptional regulator [Oscillospiraceae bacterium]|nr:helix-turn-helix transcriptional regulator [Oscillospiraceae bacterium]